ncbi:MAG TPA: hypothetical protein VIB47_05405 [Dehalococcoidia bacterium]|jgi:hypothetical protein
MGPVQPTQQTRPAGAETAREASRRFTSEERLREALTMALYVSLVLAAEFVSIEGHLESKSFAISVIWGTALGLTLAHVFAFNLSGMLFSRGTLGTEARAAMLYQVAATAGVAAVLSFPFLLLRLSEALDVDKYLVAGFIGITGWGVARTAGRSGVHALTIGLIMLALAIAVVLAKAALSAH